MYPNTAILGSSHVQSGSIISQGCSVINTDTPGNCLVFQENGKNLTFRIRKEKNEGFFEE